MIRFAVALMLCIMAFGKANAQELIVIESKNLKCNDSILIFTPKNVNENTSTLFLLHGWSGCYKDWSNKHNIQEISDRTNFRIICPDGFYNGWYLNNTDPDKMQWRTFFWSELFPMMEKRFNLSSTLIYQKKCQKRKCRQEQIFLFNMLGSLIKFGFQEFPL